VALSLVSFWTLVASFLQIHGFQKRQTSQPTFHILQAVPMLANGWGYPRTQFGQHLQGQIGCAWAQLGAMAGLLPDPSGWLTWCPARGLGAKKSKKNFCPEMF